MKAACEARFRAEVRVGGRLQHAHVIRIYVAGLDQRIAFMLMDLVRGGELKQSMEEGGHPSFDRSNGIMIELLSALDFAHQ